MKKGLFAVFAIVILGQAVSAQTTKTGVLVIGKGNNAIGAGIQAAVSGVKTVILVPGDGFELMPVKANLSSGIEWEFLERVKALKGTKDSLGNVFFDNAIANMVLKTWTDTLKNLTVIRNASWLKLKRSGRGWNIQLKDGKVIKAGVLVNADQSGKVCADIQIPVIEKQWRPFNYDNTSYRTAIAGGQAIQGSTANMLLLSDLFITGQENLVVLAPDQQSMLAGQAAGASAAYPVFYKLKTSEVNLKTVQGELLNYKLSVLPFADISNADSNWKAIQVLGLSGFLKADIVNGKANFNPDRLVTTEEIKEPVKSYYYKAQIWFDDYKKPHMTIASALDLVCKIGNKSLEHTIAEVKKKWKSAYNFKTEFDAARNISRREFAALLRDYLNPFNVNTDKSGRVQR